MSHKRRLLILAGPTASGKTAVACEIARKLPIETISCDSMQVYRGMPIVSQAPTTVQKKQLRAHLVSYLDPSKEYNAAQFRKDALKKIEQIFKNGRTPLITGGTGLYLRALLYGLFEHEDDRIDLKLRKKLLTLHEKMGAGFLYDKLRKVDAAAAQKIHPNDARRLIRALEVYELTGKPISEQQPTRKGVREQYLDPIYFLDRDRADLYTRINSRVDLMVKAGLVKEVKKLARKKLSRTASMALGLSEVGAYLDGQKTWQEALELLKQHTRNYAKRQLSWFRHEKEVRMIPVALRETPKQIAAKILKDWARVGA